MDMVGAFLIQVKMFTLGLGLHMVLYYFDPQRYRNMRASYIVGTAAVWLTFGVLVRWYTQIPLMGLWHQ